MIDRILAQLQRAHDNASTILHESTCERYENCSCDVAKDIRGFEKALKDVVFVVSEERLQALRRLRIGLRVGHKIAARSEPQAEGDPIPDVETCPCRLAQDIRALEDHLACLERNRSQVVYLCGDRPGTDSDRPQTGLEDTARQPGDEQTGRDEAKRRMYDAVAADLPASSSEGRAPLVPSYVGRCTVEGLPPSEHTFVQDEDGTRPGRVTKDGHVVPIEPDPSTPAEDRAKEEWRRECTAALEQSLIERAARGDGIVALDKRPYVQPEDLAARGPDLDDLTERSPEDSAGMVSAGNDAFDKPASSPPAVGHRPYATGGHIPEPSRSEELPAGKDWVSVTELDEQLRDKEDDSEDGTSAAFDDSGPDDFDDEGLAPAIRDGVFKMFGAAVAEVFALAARQADEMGTALRELGAALTDDEKDKPPANTVPWTDTRELNFGKLLACATRVASTAQCECSGAAGTCSTCALREAVEACAQATAR